SSRFCFDSKPGIGSHRRHGRSHAARGAQSTKLQWLRPASSKAARHSAPPEEHGPIAQSGKAIRTHVPHAAEALVGMDVCYLEVVLGAELAIRARRDQLVELKLRLAPGIVRGLLLSHD